jgi:hypothetical protein
MLNVDANFSLLIPSVTLGVCPSKFKHGGHRGEAKSCGLSGLKLRVLRVLCGGSALLRHASRNYCAPLVDFVPEFIFSHPISYRPAGSSDPTIELVVRN